MKKIVSLAMVLAMVLAMLPGLSIAQADDKITLTVLMNGNIQSFFDGEDENNNDIHTWLEEKSGYNLVYQVLPSEGGEEKRSLLLSSDDCPDIMYFGNRTLFLEYAENGYILPLEDYIANSDRLQGSDVMDENVVQMAMYDDHQYAIATPSNGSPAPDSLNGIKDLVDTLDVDMTDLSLNNIMAIFATAKQDYPDLVTYTGAGADTTNYKLSDFMWLYSAWNLTNMWREDAAGALEFTPTTDDMKACLAFIAEMNEKGYLDPEYAVTKTEKLQEKMVQKSSVFAGISWYDFPSESIEGFSPDNGKTSFWQFYGQAVGDDGRYGQTYGTPVNGYAVVMATCDHPQEAVDYISLLMTDETYDFVMFGVEGVDYEFDGNGNRKALAVGRMAVTGTQYFVYYYMHENLQQRTDRLSFTYGAAGKDYVLDRTVHYGLNLKNKADVAAAKPYIESWDSIESSINDICARYFLKIAIGAIDLEEGWTQYLAELDAIGANDAITDVAAWYANR